MLAYFGMEVSMIELVTSVNLFIVYHLLICLTIFSMEVSLTQSVYHIVMELSHSFVYK